MKILCLLLTAACLQVGANGFTQGINLSLKNASLEKFFRTVEEQSSYRFVYSSEALENTQPISIEVKNARIEDLMDRVLLNQPLAYTLKENFIVIRVREKAPVTFLPAHDIRGRVLNEKGEPVAGVTILLQGSQKMVLTDSKGEFFLTGVDENDQLLISAAEFESQRIPVGKNVTLTITLKQKVGNLDETIVIGYGTTTRRFSTGSVTKVTAEEIGRQPVTNPLAALQGRVPGLVVTSTSGLPGASFNIQVRGQNSINPNPGSNAAIPPLDNPFIIIDGVPFAPQNNNINQLRSIASPGNNPIFGNVYGGMSPLNSINPADIESVEVLRDADATAIYGSRAANGVIIITTKKGQAGKTKFNLNVNSGQSKVTRTMPLLNTNQYLAMRREAFSNDGITPTDIPGTPGFAPDLLIYDTGKYTDWKDYFLGGSASMTNINSSLSGGTANLNFLVGAGYSHESYILPGDFGSDKASVNLNLRHQSLNKRFSLDVSANYTYNKNNSSGNQFLFQAYVLPPNYPDLLDADGNLIWTYNGQPLDNPFGYMFQKYEVNNYNLNSNVQLNYEIVKGLTIRTSVGYNSFMGKEVSQQPKISLNPADNLQASAIFANNEFNTWIAEPQLEYKRSFGKAAFNILAGGTYQQNTNTQFLITGSNYSNDNLLGSITSAGTITASDAFFEKKYVAGFGRIQLIWGNKYILNLNGRRDGSSRFGPGKQFGNFGSVATGWIFSEEKWIKDNIGFLSFGKLRMSYGSTGSDNIADYQYLSRWGTGTPPYQGTAGYTPQNLYNDELHWSSTRKMEAGLELGLKNDRLFASVVWYRHRTDDQLVTYQLPTQTGFSGVTANFPALVENKGWEIQIVSYIVKNSSFNWTATFNLTIPKNTLVEFPGLDRSSYYSLYTVGESLNNLSLFRLLGVKANTGLYEFDSKNGNVINPSLSDRVSYGTSDPKYFGGFTTDFRIKNCQLNLLFEFRNQLGPNYLSQISAFGLGRAYNLPTKVLDHWQNPGDNAKIQRLSSQIGSDVTTASNSFMRSTGAYGNASYIRCKSISFSYDFTPLNTIQFIRSMRLYVSAQNLFTITGYVGNDPETLSFFSLPPLKTIVAGLQFNL